MGCCLSSEAVADDPRSCRRYFVRPVDIEDLPRDPLHRDYPEEVAATTASPQPSGAERAATRAPSNADVANDDDNVEDPDLDRVSNASGGRVSREPSDAMLSLRIKAVLTNAGDIPDEVAPTAASFRRAASRSSARVLDWLPTLASDDDAIATALSGSPKAFRGVHSSMSSTQRATRHRRTSDAYGVMSDLGSVATSGGS